MKVNQYILAPYKEQDHLLEGLIKTSENFYLNYNGLYIYIPSGNSYYAYEEDGYHHISGGLFRIAPKEQQDLLKDGMLKATRRGKPVYQSISEITFMFANKRQKLAEVQRAVLKGFGYFTGGLVDGDSICESVEDCFVATTVYGDENTPQVETLRQFRDDVLMKNSVGRAFVNAYYSGLGEKSANFIREHIPSSIAVIRDYLDTLVEWYPKHRHN